MPDKIKMTQPETPDIPQGRDMFQSPKYSVELLLPFIPVNIRRIWEPAIGLGKICEVLENKQYQVYGSDLYHTDYTDETGNFLEYQEIPAGVQCIITNPPYSIKKRFYEKCKFFKIPFALLIPCDYCGWLIDAIRYDRCEKLIPTKRIDFITPTGKSALTGQSANYHSMWLTWGFGLGRSETFVELTKEMKQNI